MPNHPNHPNGRNPYAHVALSVKQRFGDTYKNLPDKDLDKVIRFINQLKINKFKNRLIIKLYK